MRFILFLVFAAFALNIHAYSNDDIDTLGCNADLLLRKEWRKEAGAVEETLPSNDFKIKPNPASDRISIQLEITKEENNYSIYDISGKKFLEGKITLVSKEKVIDISSLPSGAYYIKIGDNSDFQTRVFLKTP